MKKLYTFTIDLLNKAIKTSLTFLSLGVVVQLLLGKGSTLLGWDPISNIQNAGSSFIGVIALVVLYLLFNKK